MDAGLDEVSTTPKKRWSRLLPQVVGILAAVLLVFLAIVAAMLYGFRRRHREISSSGAPDKRVRQLTLVLVAIVIAAFVVGAFAAIVVGVVHTIEKTKLFDPTVVSRYRNLTGTRYPLPSGGGLVHLTPG